MPGLALCRQWYRQWHRDGRALLGEGNTYAFSVARTARTSRHSVPCAHQQTTSCDRSATPPSQWLAYQGPQGTQWPQGRCATRTAYGRTQYADAPGRPFACRDQDQRVAGGGVEKLGYDDWRTGRRLLGVCARERKTIRPVLGELIQVLFGHEEA